MTVGQIFQMTDGFFGELEYGGNCCGFADNFVTSWEELGENQIT